MDWITLVTTSYYDYPSNFSNGTAVEGVGTLFVYINSVLSGALGWMLLVALGLIMFLTLKSSGYTAGKAFTATSFSLTMVSIAMMMAGILPFRFVMWLAIITIVAALTTRAESNVGL